MERTYSTGPTTISDSASKPQLKRSIVQNDCIQEETEHRVDEQDNLNLNDGESTFSLDSVVLLSGKDRDVIIRKFSDALLNGLSRKCLRPHSRPLQDPGFRRSFNQYIKGYAKRVLNDSARRTRKRQASKAIHYLRNDILLRLQNVLGGFDDVDNARKILPSIAHQASENGVQEMGFAEKFADWNSKNMDDDGNAGLYKLDLPISEPIIPAESVAFLYFHFYIIDHGDSLGIALTENIQPRSTTFRFITRNPPTT